MKLRVAWIGDSEDAASYSAKEARVLLRALARRDDLVALWFAVGSVEPPHFWNGIRVFPIPPDTLDSADFLKTLIAQQRPDVALWSIPSDRFRPGLEHLTRSGIPLISRPEPTEAQDGRSQSSGPARAAAGPSAPPPGADGSWPFLAGLEPDAQCGEEPTAALGHLQRLIEEKVPAPALTLAPCPTHLVMRQQLFCNASLAQVMFELTNALIQLGVPAVAQDDHPVFSKPYVHREEDLVRTAASGKHQRLVESLGRDYDPENAITVHFSMFRGGARGARFGTFPSLGPREVLYTTGNHTVAAGPARQLAACFEKILAPSRHVLRPYLDAGLPRAQGAVVPHGVDPSAFSPESPPRRYPTEKGFKFLQTSFPWITEKGFDLTVQAFSRAFSAHDDVALVLRTPRIRDAGERQSTFGQLQRLVGEARGKPGAPEILLLEEDIGPNGRGGVYTGANCYVFPLRAEGFSMTILEAMACGLPVIATPWSGPADFLSPRWAYTLRHSNPIPERGRDGTVLRYHVEPDLDHLVHLMRYVHRHQDEARALGTLASSVARRDWTWARAAAKLASIFHLLTVSPAPEGESGASAGPAGATAAAAEEAAFAAFSI